MRALSGTGGRPRAAAAAALAALALVLTATTFDGTRAAFSATTENANDGLATRQLQAPSDLTVSQSCSVTSTITRRSSAVTVGTAASVTLSMPAGTAAGDFLLAHVGYHDADQTLLVPGGWNLVGRTGNTSIASNVYWKVAVAGEPSATFRHPNSSSPELFIGGVTAFRDVRPAAPQFAGAVGSSATASTPSVSTTATTVQLVHLFTKTQGPLDPAVGATDYYGDATGSGSGVHVGIRGAGETFTGPGSTPSRSATAGASSRYVAQTVVLQRVVGTPTANLSWTASPSTWASGYELTRQIGSGTPVTQSVAGVGTTSATNGPLTNGTSYTFRLSTSRGSWRSTAATTGFTANCP